MRRLLALISGLLCLAGPSANAQPRASYDVTLQTAPAKPKAGQTTDLRLKVTDRRGSPITEFDLVHERPMHVIIVSQDLSEFWHVHPAADGRGSFSVSHRFPAGGDYRVYADLKPAGHTAAVVPLSLNVAGPRPSHLPLGSDRSVFVSSDDGLRIELRTSDRPTAGAQSRLEFFLTDLRNGSPVTDLEPYLGSLVHVIIVRVESLDMLHVHRSESTESAHGGTHQAHHPPSASSGDGRLVAETQFPSAGRYKIWAQVQRHGRVITSSFVITVRSSR